ncbi:MAG: UvrD-helicase domain-containing protein, partial [Deltaproteobacteria bacterium]|nr:UvrD-helicase domain-containing protein [Deltaproteobacteria bacterium]
MIDWSSDLNPAQFEAVTHISGPLLVVAGPGTGKTRVLSYRIGRLVETGTARPDQILAMTFTNQAAKEISERVSRLLCGEISAGHR